MSKYLDAAIETAGWISSTAVESQHGRAWPNVVGRPVDSGGFYHGVAGPTLFFIEAYRTTGDTRWLDEARAGGRWLIRALPGHAGPWGVGLFTGTAGMGFALSELNDVDPSGEWLDGVSLAVAELMQSSTRVDGGRTWFELSEVLWGTAGIALTLLHLADRLGNASLVSVAREAGAWLCDIAEPKPRGSRWGCGEGFYRTQPTRSYFPNFSHGTAGIAYALATLYRTTGEQRLLDAALDGAGYLLSVARTDDGGCAVFHDEPGGEDLYTLGWCHGPPSLAWLFRRLWDVTDDESWLDWITRCARTVRTSGIPERKYPGFWDNVARCCGSTGVAEFFLDLHRTTGDADALEFAIRMTDDLLDHAIVDGDGRRWSNFEFRYDNPHLPPETGFMQGASGIGSWLLRLHRFLDGDESHTRWPHSPF